MATGTFEKIDPSPGKVPSDEFVWSCPVVTMPMASPSTLPLKNFRVQRTWLSVLCMQRSTDLRIRGWYLAFRSDTETRREIRESAYALA